LDRNGKGKSFMKFTVLAVTVLLVMEGKLVEREKFLGVPSYKG
jgi:hypothetical protein